MIATLIGLGILVGTIGSMIGIGGGLLIVPIFILLFGFSVQETVGTALFIVCFNALSGTLAYVKQKNIAYSIAFKFALATIPGAIIGSYLTELLSGNTFCLLFGIFLIATALNMYRKSTTKTIIKGNEKSISRIRVQLGILCSFFTGCLSSVLGIGGGIIHVPFMNHFLHFSIHKAIATSTCILFISSLFGLFSHGFLGHILWSEALFTSIGAFLGAQIGAHFTKYISAKYLTAVFSIFVLGIGLKFIFSGLL